MRIIILTRHYPPAVSGLAPRVTELAKALRTLGAHVYVVAPSIPNGEFGIAVPHPNRDPPSTAPSPHVRFSVRGVARELLLWPDPDIRWCSKAAALAKSSVPWKPDWVLSFSPSESVHVAGNALAKHFTARHAGDFTDLWLENPHRAERKRSWRRIGEAFLARRLLDAMDSVFAVDATIAAELAALGARNPTVLPHFVGPTEPVDIKLPQDTLNVVHTGSIALSAPNSQISDLIRPFEIARASNPNLALHFVGRLDDRERRLCAASPCASAIHIHGVKSHAESIGYQRAADALAFVAPPNFHVPPSKIVEYLDAKKPIVACGDGPWRGDHRVPMEAPEVLMSTLQRGLTRQAGLPDPPTARQTARTLLAVLERAPSRSKD